MLSVTRVLPLLQHAILGTQSRAKSRAEGSCIRDLDLLKLSQIWGKQDITCQPHLFLLPSENIHRSRASRVRRFETNSDGREIENFLMSA